MEILYNEYDILKNQYTKIISMIKSNKTLLQELETPINILQFSKINVERKIDNIKIHSSTRAKRGLINGLGTIIKAITGNLDFDDGKHIQTFLNHITENQMDIQKQLNAQYSVNNKIIANFKQTVELIKYNSEELEYRILQLNRKIRDITDLTIIKEAISHLQILFNLVMDTFQDIENSITFCKQGILHPSIITTHQLYDELLKISPHYVNQMPLEVKLGNILKYEYLIKVSCEIHRNEIIYALSIPINDQHTYELFKLYSIPSKIESHYVTIIPGSRYLLKSVGGDDIKPLRQTCKHADLFYQCSQEEISNLHARCEQELMINETSYTCTFVDLHIADNHIKFIQETNQYLIIFVRPEKITIASLHDSETRELQGVFLVNGEQTRIIYRKKELLHKSISKGQTKILPKLNLHTTRSDPDMEIHLKQFTLEEIPLQSVIPINKSHNAMDSNMNFYIIIFVITFCIVFFAIGITIYFKGKRSAGRSTSERGTINENQIPF